MFNMKIKKALMLSAIVGSCIFASTANAEIIQWQSANVQLLRGNNYAVGEKQRTIATFEYANSWIYGDMFTFFDFIVPDEGGSTYYTEISPRFSLSKISGLDLSYGIVKDVLVSTTLEKANHRGPSYLYGGAVDLDILGFKYFKTNAYVRDDTQLDGKTWQLTFAWNAPFEIDGIKFLAEGFADFSGEEGTSAANQQIVPRLLVDTGNLIGIDDNKFFVGVEWHYWNNKFGIESQRQSTPQLQAKWVF